MRTYQVCLKSAGGADPLRESHAAAATLPVQADDVDLDYSGEGESCTLFWNFLDKSNKGDSITVAAFPFSEVLYITSGAV